jgi:hypothetical protein
LLKRLKSGDKPHPEISVADPDSTYQPDADPNSDFYFMRMRIRIRMRIRLFTLMRIRIRLITHFDADPDTDPDPDADPDLVFYAVADPDYQNDADPYLQHNSSFVKLLQIPKSRPFLLVSIPIRTPIRVYGVRVPVRYWNLPKIYQPLC